MGRCQPMGNGRISNLLECQVASAQVGVLNQSHGECFSKAMGNWVYELKQSAAFQTFLGVSISPYLVRKRGFQYTAQPLQVGSWLQHFAAGTATTQGCTFFPIFGFVFLVVIRWRVVPRQEKATSNRIMAI